MIKKNHIRNPQRYLFALHPGDRFYVATPLASNDYARLCQYGILPDSQPRIPIPHRAATKANMDGKWIPLKNLPKEIRRIQHAYHIVDWHGNDHYGTCWQSKLCYQRELLPPTELAFAIEDGILYSPLLTNSEDDMGTIKAAMNVMLEMVGHCEIWTVDRAPAVPPIKQETVPWEILPAGTRDPSTLKEYITRSTQHKSKGQQAIILDRHEHLWHMDPDFCVVGTQSFWGYVVYGFTDQDLFVFECNEVNNATYVFKGDWDTASKLTKTEVLTGHLHEVRLYHTENWYQTVGEMLTHGNQEVV
ncbi:hypothetical protein [Evtepia sp.]|uniref:hypothetical protein n=1 Tax=Evtepia sp. TaxID=2773933 RepID=UPI002A810CF9|nr:hypothetical protein [Evtepia sp.]MDY4429494.1 hypothetical protein [Evtepia sp.]